MQTEVSLYNIREDVSSRSDCEFVKDNPNEENSQCQDHSQTGSHTNPCDISTGLAKITWTSTPEQWLQMAQKSPTRQKGSAMMPMLGMTVPIRMPNSGIQL
jgi:hypothetical protein